MSPAKTVSCITMSLLEGRDYNSSCGAQEDSSADYLLSQQRFNMLTRAKYPPTLFTDTTDSTGELVIFLKLGYI